jgi:hypothetical protein
MLLFVKEAKYLGEYKRYGHGLLLPHNPPIVEVPWLIIEKETEKVVEHSEKDALKDKIRTLKRIKKI